MAHWTRRTTGVMMANMRTTLAGEQRESFIDLRGQMMTVMRRSDSISHLPMLTGVWSKGKKTARQNPAIASQLS
jgi:hypothetical protein